MFQEINGLPSCEETNSLHVQRKQGDPHVLFI